MVKMDLGSSTSQASSTATMTASRIAAYDALISSLSTFSGEASLSGAAYDSAKALLLRLWYRLFRVGFFYQKLSVRR
ncbi:hypothetical protein N1495_07755 [Streptococcus didelphis]|uniref:hypothetical protein n=1 Tax=Streptococcus didelphis TaxID=102886 RepID=UPI0027D25CFF|nr:hypothetical protein [Streptococcus didelphis]WMB29254.1 hypothetical protein N1495_07755 [Streptococcus didelphis]